MNLRNSIKAVLTHLDADHLIILCYDQFPKLYATFEPPKPSQTILVAMLLDHAEETDQLKRLAKRFGLPTEKPKKGDPSIQAEQLAIVKDKAKVTGGIHFGDIKK